MATSFTGKDGSDPHPFPTFSVLALPHILATVLIVTRASRLFRFSFILGYAGYVVHACLQLQSGVYVTDSVLTTYIVGTTAAGQILTNAALLWFLESDLSGRKQVLDVVRHDDDKGMSTAPAERGFLARLWWAFCLDCSPRNVGWSIEVKNVPKQARIPTRGEFIVKSLFRAAKLYLIVDAGIWYTHRSHLVYGSGAISISSLPFHQQCLTVYFLGAAAYGTIYIQYTLLSIVCVGSRFSEPKRWPNLFGSWRDAYTVRKFWGNVWHQFTRRFTGPLSSAAVDLLHIRRGTRLSSNTQLLVAFSFSAAVHFAGDVTTAASLTRPSALFFLVQPFAIMFEDLVVDTVNGGRGKPARFTSGVARGAAKILGYCWMFGWFVWSLPLFYDAQMLVGLGESRAIPKEWSVVEWVADKYFA